MRFPENAYLRIRPRWNTETGWQCITMKKAIKIILWSLLGLVVLFGVYAWTLFGPLVKGAMSVEKLDEGLYYMEYKGDDGFDESWWDT